MKNEGNTERAMKAGSIAADIAQIGATIAYTTAKIEVELGRGKVPVRHTMGQSGA